MCSSLHFWTFPTIISHKKTYKLKMSMTTKNIKNIYKSSIKTTFCLSSVYTSDSKSVFLSETNKTLLLICVFYCSLSGVIINQHNTPGDQSFIIHFTVIMRTISYIPLSLK